MGQAVIENQALNVAAVDPATYRLFTPRVTPTRRSSGTGSPAASSPSRPELEKKLPIDKDDFLRLGTASDAPEVHIGAYAPQVEGAVDAVVNEKWGEDLGLQPGNALLVSTGRRSPPVAAQADRADRRQPGLDPDARRRRARRPRHQRPADRVRRGQRRRRGRRLQLHRHRRRPDRTGPGLGALAHRHRAGTDPRHRHLQQADLPAAARRAAGRRSTAAWPTRSTRASTPAATTRASSPARPRCPTTPSASPSTSTCPATSAAPSARWTAASSTIFKKWGFAWGGDWSYTDPMHFEMARLVEPR